GSRLHLSCLSSAGSVELVRRAKERGLPVTASVAALNLAFDDSAVRDFDTLFKVLPPLRSPEDRLALIQGLKDGTLDFIVSNHVPLEEELKNVEFPFAAFGATGLEGAFALSRFHLREHLNIEDLVEKWALAPRRLLGLPIPEISPGAEARFTLLQPDESWTFTPEHIRSRSRNSPLPGQTLLGRVRGVIAGGEFLEQL
ncbi:MAG: dihydroorotase, partial [Bacteroidetes bacterium]